MNGAASNATLLFLRPRPAKKQYTPKRALFFPKFREASPAAAARNWLAGDVKPDKMSREEHGRFFGPCLQQAGEQRSRGMTVLSFSATAKQLSVADVAGVERARDGGVLCSFEDGAAIGKDGHFVRGDAEAKKKLVLTYVRSGQDETVAK